MFQMRTRTRLAILVFCIVFLSGGVLQTVAAQQLQNLPTIRAINITGNVSIDTAVIQSAITKTRVNTIFVDTNIMDDIEAIFSLGHFLDVFATFELTPDGGIKVIFQVVENPTLAGIVFEGAENVPVDDFKREMQAKPGDILNHNILYEDLTAFAQWAYDQHGIVLRPTSVDITEEGVIIIEVAESRVEAIHIEGNEKTKDHVILRELSFEPGDILDFTEVNSSLQRVMMLGFFDEISYSIEDGTDPDSAILVVEVKELKTGSADFGAGYSSRSGLFGYVDVSDENFLGNGQRTNIFFEIGKGRRSYKLGFFEPYLFENGTSFGINVYNNHDDIEREYVEYEDPVTGTQHVFGGDITIGHPLGEFTRGNLTLRADRFRYSGDIDQVLSPFVLLNVGAGLTTNTTNHPFTPNEGYKNNINLETGLTFLDDTAMYSKITLSHSRYFRLFRDDLTLAIRGLGGRSLSGALPDSEMFRIGGAESLRGYNYGQTGLVGDKMLLLNTELRFPIYDFISGVVFTDWGKAWEPEERMSLTDLFNSYGLGVRVNTPLGMIRLDYGWGLNEESKREGQFSFGLGHTF